MKFANVILGFVSYVILRVDVVVAGGKKKLFFDTKFTEQVALKQLRDLDVKFWIQVHPLLEATEEGVKILDRNKYCPDDWEGDENQAGCFRPDRVRIKYPLDVKTAMKDTDKLYKILRYLSGRGYSRAQDFEYNFYFLPKIKGYLDEMIALYGKCRDMRHQDAMAKVKDAIIRAESALNIFNRLRRERRTYREDGNGLTVLQQFGNALYQWCDGGQYFEDHWERELMYLYQHKILVTNEDWMRWLEKQRRIYANKEALDRWVALPAGANPCPPWYLKYIYAKKRLHAFNHVLRDGFRKEEERMRGDAMDKYGFVRGGRPQLLPPQEPDHYNVQGSNSAPQDETQSGLNDSNNGKAQEEAQPSEPASTDDKTNDNNNENEDVKNEDEGENKVDDQGEDEHEHEYDDKDVDEDEDEDENTDEDDDSENDEEESEDGDGLPNAIAQFTGWMLHGEFNRPGPSPFFPLKKLVKNYDPKYHPRGKDYYISDLIRDGLDLGWTLPPKPVRRLFGNRIRHGKWAPPGPAPAATDDNTVPVRFSDRPHGRGFKLKAFKGEPRAVYPTGYHA